MISIYCYENKINGKLYIGQTDNIKKRDRQHTFHGRKCMAIDGAIKKYGRDNFDLFVVSIVDTIDQADQEEIYWIDQMRYYLSINKVYNIMNGGTGGSRGRIITQETKDKIRKANTGKIRSEESKRKQSITTTGRKFSDEHNKNVSEGLMGHYTSQETKDKISQAHMGKILSEEHKQKISEGNKGKTVIHSNATRQKMSESGKVKIFTETHLKNMSLAQTGRKHTEETKLKMSQSSKLFHSNQTEESKLEMLGENNRGAKLNNIKVQEIRDLYATGNYTSRQLAKQFEVGKSTILRVINNKSWTKV